MPRGRMAFLIDGNNVIGRWPGLDLSDPTSRDALIGKLAVFQKVRRKRIILVFDGPPAIFPLRREINPRFHVLHPGEDGDADMLIKDMISGRKDKKGLIVVSSDRDIRDHAGSRGFTGLTAPEFIRLVRAALKEGRKARELDKSEGPPTPVEQKLWVELFSRKRRNP